MQHKIRTMTGLLWAMALPVGAQLAHARNDGPNVGWTESSNALSREQVREADFIPDGAGAVQPSLPEVTPPLGSDGGAYIPTPRELPDDVGIEQHAAYAEGGEARAVADAADGFLVYSNTRSKQVTGPAGMAATARIADDVTTTMRAGCMLDKYVIRVTGDRDNTGNAPPFSVLTGLYATCPGGGGATAMNEWAQCTFMDLSGTSVKELTCYIGEGVNVPLPDNFYVAVRFSRDNCGVVVGAPPELGFSADWFDFPGFPCHAYFGGYPGGPGYERRHASFWLQVYTKDDCAKSFVGYKNSNQGGDRYTPGANIYFADDITLGVPECNLIAYEFAMKGSGILKTDLRTFLGDTNPDTGGLIAGTQKVSASVSSYPKVVRVPIDPPIPLPTNLYITFKTSSGSVGPILTKMPAALGSTENYFLPYYDYVWEERTFGPETCAAFDVTIMCAGEPPSGACCDTIHRDDAGEAVCRELPEMNCPFNRWVEGKDCDSAPFYPACGLSACCLPDDSCENLTANECAALAGNAYQRDRFCYVGDQHCPFYACTLREGECCGARGPGEAGCENPFCCTDVCSVDRFCCRTEWDQQCADTAAEICEWCWPDNDHCPDALLLEVPGSVSGNGFGATEDANDPGFGCQTDDPGAQGFGTLWYKFVATESSARLSTCTSDPPAYDTLLQVLRPEVADDPCSSLVPMRCSDDATRCAPSDANSELCVFNLVPGDTYYVMVAAKTEDTKGTYQLDIASPCDLDIPPLHNDRCEDGEVIHGVQQALTYDLSGQAFREQPATPDAPADTCVPVSIDDAWFQWTSPCYGELTIETLPVLSSHPTIAVYAGCGCPVEAGRLIACSAAAVAQASSSPVQLGVTEGDCYMLRIGGSNEGWALGELRLSADCFACPPGQVTFLDPPNGVVDARNPGEYGGGSWPYWRGIDTFLVQAPPGADNPECWSLCIGSYYDAYNQVREVNGKGDGTYAVRTTFGITPGAVSSLIYTDDFGQATTGLFWYHPGNINADGYANAIDVLALIDIINDAAAAPYATYSGDCDWSGEIGPADLLCLIDLFAQPPSIYGPWYGTRLPNDLNGYCRILCGGRDARPCEPGEFCRFLVGRCDLQEDVGACVPVPERCPAEVAPVCGCDGLTYSNECYADAVGVSVEHTGECEP